MGAEIDELWEQYGLDCADALSQVEESLLALEARPSDAEQVRRLYRNLHRIKGNSAIVALKWVERLAHVAEDVVGVVRDQGAEVDPSLIDMMLWVADGLRDAVTTASQHRADVTEGSVAPHIARAHAWMEGQSLSIAESSSAAVHEGVVLWSSLPAGPPSRRAPAPDAEAIGFFLTLARELVAVLLDGASDERAAVEPPPVARRTPTEACDELLAAAQRLDLEAVTKPLQALAEALRAGAGDLTSLELRVCEGLAALEAQVAPAGPGFGMAEALRRCSARAGVSPPASPEPIAVAPRVGTPTPVAPPEPGLAAVAPDATSKTDFLRVDARKVSLVMDLAGEIGQVASLVSSHPELSGLALEGFSATTHKLEVLIRELQSEVAGIRLIPVAGVFQRMRRVVRDAARRTGKSVVLELIGEDTEIDKVMVDQLSDPLVHLLRNAVDHGIEAPDVRARLGKPPVARVVLEATNQAGEVSVHVRDDGAGIDLERVLARARERGLVPLDQRPSDQELVDFIFAPGFSTKAIVDELSGRGVGMDLVKTTVEAMRGRVHLASVPGRGTHITLRVPLTLAFLEAMVVKEAERLYAVPVEKVIEVLRANEGHVVRSSGDGGAEIVRLRERLVPVVWLHEYYGGAVAPHRRIAGHVIVIVQAASGPMALPVDALLGNEHVMIKPLQGILSRVRAGAGYGMLRSGAVALALDCEQLSV